MVVAATELEVGPTLERYAPEKKRWGYGKGPLSLWITGVGAANTALKTAFFAHIDDKADLWINVGIAGAYDAEAELGAVWEVVSERYGDVGAETSEGLSTALELGFPLSSYPQDVFFNPRPHGLMRPGAGLTVQTCSGTEQTIALRRIKFHCDLETMEGAAFFQSALWHGVDFWAFRAVSNYVAPRDVSAWKIRPAVQNLNEAMWRILEDELTLRQ